LAPPRVSTGSDEIEAFRKGRSPANLARTIKRLDIVAFGKDFASITLAFEREIEGRVTRGRQSQTWVRLPEGWRIVFAHVSILALKACPEMRFRGICLHLSWGSHQGQAILLGSAIDFGLSSQQLLEIHSPVEFWAVTLS
jgi:hypothetical protein